MRTLEYIESHSIWTRLSLALHLIFKQQCKQKTSSFCHGDVSLSRIMKIENCRDFHNAPYARYSLNVRSIQ
jgi:hypothetical protein